MICVKCKEIESKIESNQGSLCEECFQDYVQRKVWKNLDSICDKFQLSGKNKTRKMLVAFSGGTASVALVNILMNYIKRQAKLRKPVSDAFTVINIADFDNLDNLRQIYPSFEFRSVPLKSVLELGAISFPEGNFGKGADLHQLLTAFNNPTSHQDGIEILKRHLLRKIALDIGCIGILCGDSLTKIAESILSHTAKGQYTDFGNELSDHIGNEIYILRPMRNVLHYELMQYNTTCSIDQFVQLSGSLNRPLRETTITELMRNYIESVQKKFPSVTSTVMNIADKLICSSNGNQPLHFYAYCKFCGSGRYTSNHSIYGKLNHQASNCLEFEHILCHSCQIMLKDSTSIPWTIQ